MASATLVIRILADATQAARGMQQASGTAGKLGAGLNKAAIPALAMVAGLGHAAKAAADDQKAQLLLANALHKSAGATDAQVASTEDWISKTAFATGVADDQLRPAMSTLARATGDVTAAQGAMATVLDVSAATGKDVETVAAAMAKAYAGNTTALGKMVPGIDKGVLATKDMTKITAELARTMGGSAAVQANSAAGQYERFKLALQETEESIGAALLPTLSTLGGVLRQGATWAAQHAGAMATIVKVVGALAAAVLAAKVGLVAYNIVQGITAGLTATSTAAIEGQSLAMVTYAARMAIVKTAQLAARTATLLWTAAQWLLNAALTANPIGLIIALVAALVIAIVIAYKKSQTFRNIVQGAWRGIQAAAQFVWNNVLKPIFKFIIAYYQALWTVAQRAAALVVAAWNGMKAGLLAAWNWIKRNVIDKLVQAFRNAQSSAQTMRNVIAGVWTAIKNAISNAWTTIKGIFDRFVGAIQNVISWLKKISIPSAVSGLLGKIGIRATAAPAVAAPVATARGARATTTTTVQSRQSAAPIVVNVILDGKRVGGYVDRLITSRLDAEGARLAAGAWA